MKFLFIILVVAVYCGEKIFVKFNEEESNLKVEVRYEDEIERLMDRISSVFKNNKYQINLNDELVVKTDKGFSMNDLVLSDFTFNENSKVIWKVDEDNILIVKIENPFTFKFSGKYKKVILRIFNLYGDAEGLVFVEKISAKILYKIVHGEEITITDLVTVYLNKNKEIENNTNGLATRLFNVNEKVSNLFNTRLMNLIENKLNSLIASSLKRDRKDSILPLEHAFNINTKNEPIKLHIQPLYVKLKNDSYIVEYLSSSNKLPSTIRNDKSINLDIRHNKIKLYSGFFNQVFNYYDEKNIEIDMRLRSEIFDSKLLPESISNYFKGVTHGMFHIKKLNNVDVDNNQLKGLIFGSLELFMKKDKPVRIFDAEIKADYNGVVSINSNDSKLMVKINRFRNISIHNIKLNENYQSKISDVKETDLTPFIRDCLEYMENVVIGYLNIKSEDKIKRKNK
jgi:hypothetical protein